MQPTIFANKLIELPGITQSNPESILNQEGSNQCWREGFDVNYNTRSNAGAALSAERNEHCPGKLLGKREGEREVGEESASKPTVRRFLESFLGIVLKTRERAFGFLNSICFAMGCLS